MRSVWFSSADIIDFMDKVLRVYCRNMREPSGQAAASGGQFQLEPVVRELTKCHPRAQSLSTAVFFDAKVFEFKLVSSNCHTQPERSRFHQHPRPSTPAAYRDSSALNQRSSSSMRADSKLATLTRDTALSRRVSGRAVSPYIRTVPQDGGSSCSRMISSIRGEWHAGHHHRFDEDRGCQIYVRTERRM